MYSAGNTMQRVSMVCSQDQNPIRAASIRKTTRGVNSRADWYAAWMVSDQGSFDTVQPEQLRTVESNVVVRRLEDEQRQG